MNLQPRHHKGSHCRTPQEPHLRACRCLTDTDTDTSTDKENNNDND